MCVGMLLFALTVTSTQNSLTRTVQQLSASPWMKLLPYGVSGTLVLLGLRTFFQIQNPQTKPTRIGDNVWADKEKVRSSVNHLSRKQQRQIRGVSWGALINPFIWAIANNQHVALTLLFVPGVNLIVWLLLFVNGRQVAWLAQVEVDIETYIRREREILIISLIMTCCFFLMTAT